MLDNYQCPKDPKLVESCVGLFKNREKGNISETDFLRKVYLIAYQNKDCLNDLRYREPPNNPPKALLVYRNMSRGEKWIWLRGRGDKKGHPNFFREGDVSNFLDSCSKIKHRNKANKEKLETMREVLKDDLEIATTLNHMLSTFIVDEAQLEEPYISPEEEKELSRDESVQKVKKEFGGKVTKDWHKPKGWGEEE